MARARAPLELQISGVERRPAGVDLLWREPCRRSRCGGRGDDHRVLFQDRHGRLLWRGNAVVPPRRTAAPGNCRGDAGAAGPDALARVHGALLARNTGTGRQYGCVDRLYGAVDVVQSVRDATRCVRGRCRPPVVAVGSNRTAAPHCAVCSRRSSDVLTSMGLNSLHITNAYHPSSGGIRTFYTALLEAANRERRRVCLLVPGPRDADEEVGQFGTIYFVRAPLAPVFDRRYRLILQIHFITRQPGLVTRIPDREQPDLVQISDKYSLPYLAAMLRKRWHPRVPRPVLAGLTCERFDDNMAAFCSSSRPARAFTRWYIRHIYGPPFDVHIANSEYTAGELRAALADRPLGFIRVAPRGVHAEYFGPQWRREVMSERLLRHTRGT